MEKIEKLFLDDERPCPTGWKLARNYNEFKSIIEVFGVPETISFDHDLGYEHYKDAATGVIDYTKYVEKTGYDCAKLLVERGQFPRLAIVHSFSPVGAQNIANLLRPYSVVLVAPWNPRNYEGRDDV